MRQQIKLVIPRRLGILMQDQDLDKIMIQIDQYDIILELTDDFNKIPNNIRLPYPWLGD